MIKKDLDVIDDIAWKYQNLASQQNSRRIVTGCIKIEELCVPNSINGT